MNEKYDKIDRRGFFKTMGAAGLGSVFASAQTKADPNEPITANPTTKKVKKPKFPQVPKRKFSERINVKVPVLSLGTLFNVAENQIVLRKAIDWGVTYWDTAPAYAGGNAELGIGKYLAKHPEVRKKVFIATKASGAGTPAEVEDRLQASLKRMNMDYIDLYYGVHSLSNPASLTDELGQWAKSAKKRNLIRYFGFSTHSNMAKCLAAAAKLDWIDGILTTYNFRLMHDPEMQAAIDACHKAGIGLTVMKSQSLKIESPEDKKLTQHFLQRGFTEGQAKIKAVLQDKRFGAVTVGMANVALLTSNVAAVLDKTKLATADMNVFKEYAQQTCSGYCLGCAEICQNALPDNPYVSDIMRYLMYYNSYGDRDRARELFAQIPAPLRNNLLSIDYRPAEARCPQHLPIRKFIKEAATKLA